MKTAISFSIKSRSVLAIMRNVSDKSCRETHIVRFMFDNLFFPENRGVYEIMWKNIVERVRPQMTTWLMRIACWITKATNTHSEFVILIAFPLQQRLYERASMLRYTGVLISPQPDQEGNKLQRQKIQIFIYPIYNHNWRNLIVFIYIYI